MLMMKYHFDTNRGKFNFDKFLYPKNKFTKKENEENAKKRRDFHRKQFLKRMTKWKMKFF